jgi:hypothetical protein
MVLKTGPEGELGQADPREVVTDPSIVLGPGLGRHREHVLGLVEGSPKGYRGSTTSTRLPELGDGVARARPGEGILGNLGHRIKVSLRNYWRFWGFFCQGLI